MKSVIKLVFLVVFTSLYSQNQKNIISKALENYFSNNKSSIHIHLNKTTFITGEEIWFTAYGFIRNSGIIELKNQNVIVGLYNDNNIEVKKSFLLLDKGSSSGNILLEKELQTGTYYIRAFNLTMNDLEHDESFIQPIKIINPNDINDTSETNNEILSYDIQILPEGGHLVTSINNTCGIKVINSYGKGVKTENLQLVDSNDKIIINNIKTNTLGMGKFNFTPKPGSSYTIKHKNVPIDRSLPKIKKLGLVLKSDQNFKTGDIQVTLETNKETLNSLAGKDVTLMIHKDNLSKGYTIKFENNFPKIILNIPNKDLFSGVNTITVFNENQKPILERLFFNHKSIKPVSTYVTEIEKKKDTFSYSILNKIDKQTIFSQTSISVLPYTNSANTNRSNIYASVYLQPFLKGYIEDPNYYFKKNDNQKQYEIDLLLLNQGWRKYRWQSIFNKKNNIPVNNQSGISINGYVVPINSKDKPVNILLYSEDNEKIELVELDKKLQFEITGLKFKEDSNFEFSATNKNGKPIKANFFYTITPRNEELANKFIIPPNNPFSSESLNSSSIFSSFEGEELDEVIINAKKLRFKKFAQDRFGVKVDSSLYVYQTIGNYFKVKEGLEPKVFLGSMFSPPGLDYAYRIGGNRAVFIVDGKRATLSNGLLDIPMKHVIELYHGGLVRRGVRGSHIIFTDGQYNTIPDNLKTAKEFSLDNTGYTTEKEFYTPLYTNYNSTNYLKYGTVSWHKRVIPNEDGYAKIDLINPGVHDLIFHIEGFSDLGEPISSVVTVKNKSKP